MVVCKYLSANTPVTVNLANFATGSTFDELAKPELAGALNLSP